MTTSAPLVKAAIYAAAQSIYSSPTLVTYGGPGSYKPDEIVAVMGQRTVNAMGPMSSARKRDENVETVVVISVYRAGSETVQQAATERAYALLDLLVEYVRTHETLGVTGCREARVTEHELDEVTTYSRENKPTGRASSIAAVVTTTTRV